jgi:hypothetical protein
MALCSNCGEDNPDKAKFCLECGAALGVARVAQAEERKVVSILFVALVGFTATSHGADPEEEALLRFQEAADQWHEFGYPLEEALALRGALS